MRVCSLSGKRDRRLKEGASEAGEQRRQGNREALRHQLQIEDGNIPLPPLLVRKGAPVNAHLFGITTIARAVSCYTPFINSETLSPNPFDRTSSSGRHTFFFPVSISEMCPRSIPNWYAISTWDNPLLILSSRTLWPNLAAILLDTL
jgi:hypothetical protein